MKEELETLQKEIRDVKYNRFQADNCCTVSNEEINANTTSIKSLIDDKKNLSRALIEMNRKKRDMQEKLKNLTIKCDGFVNRIRVLVEKEKKETTIYLHE